MLRHNCSIRLTRPEVERFKLITGFEPSTVRTIDDLNAYVARCKAHYRGSSRDTQFLHWLIDQERDRCLKAA